jgi:phenylalanine ammonia-lyase
VTGSFDARKALSPATRPLYEAARKAAGGAPDRAKPLHWDDFDGFIETKVNGILAQIVAGGPVVEAVAAVRDSLRGHRG